MRLIDADVLVETLADQIKANESGTSASDMAAKEVLKGFIGLVNGQPSAQQWIPVSERLPDSSKQVLVYARSVHYALAKYDEMREADGSYKKQWVTFDAWKPFYTIKDVIAWVPLPAPYKGGERE